MSTTKLDSAAGVLGLALLAVLLSGLLTGKDKAQQALSLDPPAIATDKTVKYDYDVVYVRLPRKGYRGDKTNKFREPHLGAGRGADPDASGGRPDAAASRRKGGGARTRR